MADTNIALLTQAQENIYEIQERFEEVRSDKSIIFTREAEFALQILGGNEYLLKVALGNKESLQNAITNVSAIGISLNPALKQAYLVPRKGRICLDISYMGLMDLAMATGSVMWAQCRVVHEKDNFVLRGLTEQPVHEFHPFSKVRGSIVGAYVVVKTRDGDYLTHTMDIDAIYSTRDRSEAWKSYLKDKSKLNPWVTDEVEMIKKTVVKQACKYWPRVDRLDEAIHYLNTDGAEGLDALAKPEEPVIDQTVLKAAEDAAALGMESYAGFWKDSTKDVRRMLAPKHESLKAKAASADAARTVDEEAPNSPLTRATADATGDPWLDDFNNAEAAQKGK